MASKKQGGGVDTSISKKGRPGGPTSMDRKLHGRNMSEALNQKGKLGKGK